MTSPDIPLIGSHDRVEAGSALLTFVEPHADHAIEYNRWYERDHYFSGVMMGPWVLGGRRFVAPRALKALRYVGAGWSFPADKGAYLAVYMVQQDHEYDFLSWGGAQLNWLREQPGRMNSHRNHLMGGMQDLRWTLTPNGDEFPAHLATERCFPGLAMVIGDLTPGQDPAAVDAWHRRHLRDFPIADTWALAVAFNPGSGSFMPSHPVIGTDQRFVHLHFLDSDPLVSGVGGFDAYRDAFEASGLGKIAFMSPFVPTIAGTDRYADDL